VTVPAPELFPPAGFKCARAVVKRTLRVFDPGDRMNIRRHSFVLLLALPAAAAVAQSAGSSLNLQLPPADAPVAASTTARHAKPGVYYGDTSGRTYGVSAPPAPACDDATYNQPRMHGNVTTGVFSAGRRGSGTWGGANVNIRKAFGSCEQPAGGLSISIGAGSGHFHGHGF
jgi:hypothetical protein